MRDPFRATRAELAPGGVCSACWAASEELPAASWKGTQLTALTESCVHAGRAGFAVWRPSGGRRGGRMRKKYDPREFQRQLERRNAAARAEAAGFAQAAEAPALQAPPADAADKPRCLAGSERDKVSAHAPPHTPWPSGR